MKKDPSLDEGFSQLRMRRKLTGKLFGKKQEWEKKAMQVFQTRET